MFYPSNPSLPMTCIKHHGIETVKTTSQLEFVFNFISQGFNNEVIRVTSATCLLSLPAPPRPQKTKKPQDEC